MDDIYDAYDGPDMVVTPGESITLFTPKTERARQWIETLIEPEWLYWGDALEVDSRYTGSLIAEMEDELEVE